MIASYACIAYNACMQYTIRNIPPALDTAMREEARRQKLSLNQTVLDALSRSLGLSQEPQRLRDLGDIAGSWIEDPEFDQAIADQDRIDEELWK